MTSTRSVGRPWVIGSAVGEGVLRGGTGHAKALHSFTLGASPRLVYWRVRLRTFTEVDRKARSGVESYPHANDSEKEDGSGWVRKTL